MAPAWSLLPSMCQNFPYQKNLKISKVLINNNLCKINRDLRIPSLSAYNVYNPHMVRVLSFIPLRCVKIALVNK